MPNHGFQTAVYVQPAPGMAGDFASTNPNRHSYLFGPGGAVAGPNGLTIGNFCWVSDQAIDQDNAPTIVNNYGAGPVAGLVHREQQGLITQYLSNAGLLIPLGFGVTVMDGGDYFVINSGAAINKLGQKAYANFVDGSVTFGALATPTAGGVSTGSTVAAATIGFTGSLAGNVLTVSAMSSGVIYPGATITNAGPTVAVGTMIVAQLTSTEAAGALGGRGTYAVSIPEQTVASGAMTGTWGLLTIGTLVSGSYNIGDVITGGTVAAGSTISMDSRGSGLVTALTGSGGAGTYAINNNTAAVSAAINVSAQNVETNFYAASRGGAGELVKITSIPLGRTI